jgi:hypothetical protein
MATDLDLRGSSTVLGTPLAARLRPDIGAAVPGAIVVALMLIWAVHNGGYDMDTWYWGGLVLLALLAALIVTRGADRTRPHGPTRTALIAFGLYVAWSYLSIAWAQSPGDALDGSNKALVYLLMFAVSVTIPWTPRAALALLVTFALAIGVVSLVLLLRLASADRVDSLVIDGRLAAPTGYFNATAALFTLNALTALALATRRELPGLVRGALAATACAGVQLALIVQSRGWLFTLPLVAIVAIIVVRDRLRVVAFSVLPLAGALVALRQLLHVYQTGPGLSHAAQSAGRLALVVCAVVLVLGSVLAWLDELRRLPSVKPTSRRGLGAGLATLAIAAAVVGGVVATHGHPFRFISRQWNGFSHIQTSSTGSHFGDVGSGRYDFWRVSVDAVLAHPIGGLGQDNFADYYVTRRRTGEEPSWTHSLELRLLAHTGVVGFALFATFLGAALLAAARGLRRERDTLAPAVTAAALLPLTVWLIHGSVDWFWEMPALSGAALGFLGMAVALSSPQTRVARDAERRRRVPPPVARVVGAVALIAAAAALGLPYLSVREVSNASNIAASDPAGALSDLATAADLNPLSPVPGRLAGRIALGAGDYEVAEQRFSQAISREPGGWFAWFGRGLAASALGDVQQASHDLTRARSINSSQPAIKEVLARLDTDHPLTPAAGLRAIAVVK